MPGASEVDLADSFVKQGFALLDQERVEDAQRAFEAAIAVRADCAEGHYGLSWCLLAKGEFERGWVEHEWRIKCKALAPEKRFDRPRWDGSDLRGKTILIYQEQGLGDTIQHVRYAPMLAERGARVILGCDRPLAALLSRSPGVHAIAPSQHQIPPFDVHVSLHSLPLMFGTTLATIPARVPYVFPDPAAVKRWEARAGKRGDVLRVGLRWSGNPKHPYNAVRSMDPALLAMLAKIPRVQFYSLQKDLTIEQSRRLPAELNLIDWALEFRDWNDSAAALMQLDLVITTDTSIPHLAGALGLKTWTLLAFHSDWRWMVGPENSPWYPTMRLLRQPRAGDWGSVLQPVARELRALAEGT